MITEQNEAEPNATGVEPGEGYRLLVEGEIRQGGDECCAFGVGPWEPVIDSWLGKRFRKHHTPVRRKTQPVDPPLRLREGGYYRLRNGRTVGPLVANKTGYLEGTHPFAFCNGGDDWTKWRPNGLYFNVHMRDSTAEEDIISELPAPNTDEQPLTPVYYEAKVREQAARIRELELEAEHYARVIGDMRKDIREGNITVVPRIPKPGQYPEKVMDVLKERDDLQEQVKRLTEDLESHAWEVTPAMAQATIDQHCKTIEMLRAQVKELSFKIRRHRGHLLIAQGWLFLDNPTKALELVNQWLDKTPHSPEVETV